ncbi:MAG: hypothetical protein COX57_07260 [Alphaproteobacteria bacterium CG_4_10_14_0_2_um_filter_63_37]|nr:MAG: hypothetical protein AUJ55_02065 [Proteobacteria bacterium CG1_02_64_396]PJA24673.1 MAG: hypothetical protein COX57_07260 [Alphaproteobacteria bacterium CG_4_10_14_0_2_um_filter_63_37]
MSSSGPVLGWKTDSVAFGRFVQPALEGLPQRLTHKGSAVLCSPDGFNLCSVGVTSDQIGKMAALASSLIAIGEATASAVHTDAASAEQLDLLTLQSGSLTTVCIKVPCLDSYLLLMVSAHATALGVVLTVTRSVADEVGKRLTRLRGI